MAVAMAVVPAARAQEKGFVTQVLLVTNFDSDDSKDRKLGIKAADAVRDRIDDAYGKKDLKVVSKGEVRVWLENAGMSYDMELSSFELKALARYTRADERVMGTVRRTEKGYRLEPRLLLYRDDRLEQPIAPVEAASLDAAADAVAKEIVAARRQFGPLRRCENLAREGKYEQSATAGREGIRAYARAIPARLCLMSALAELGRPDEMIRVGREALALAPANPIGLELIANAYETVKDRPNAADAWTRLFATDTASEAIAEKVLTALSRLGHTREAEPLVVRAVAQHPENLALLRLEWLIYLANSNWKGAIAAGESLLVKDEAARNDPETHRRLASAYRNDAQPIRALATAALAVRQFPKDVELYVLYTQLVRAESDSVLPRGIALFPDAAELRVVQAQQLKGAGKLEQSMEATKRALALNPGLPKGFLQLAQMQFDLGQPDSAIASLQQALANGEQPELVSQYALARGNSLYRSAVVTQTRDDFLRAQRLLQLADSLAPSNEAKFLIGAAALSVSQSAATDAPKEKSCTLSKLAEEALNSAQYNLASGGAVSPEAATQYLDYVSKLRPYVESQVKAFCS
jgi:tetratricopeptide (TPR) repeat protein